MVVEISANHLVCYRFCWFLFGKRPYFASSTHRTRWATRRGVVGASVKPRWMPLLSAEAFKGSGALYCS